MTTGDTSYVSSTIIDGNQSGSVVTFENGENDNAILYGFTVSNGASQKGGILLGNANPKLKRLHIHGNSASKGWGFTDQMLLTAIMDSLKVYDNESSIGGGVLDYFSILLKNSKVYNNYASSYGGGLSIFGYSFLYWKSIYN